MKRYLILIIVAVLTISTTAISATKTLDQCLIDGIIGSSITDEPTYGSEVLSDSGWTSSGWTGSFAAGWTHTPGNTTALSHSAPAVIATYYKVLLTVTGRTAGSFTISFGGQTFAGWLESDILGPCATTTGNLTITPTTDFDGTIVISIKPITAGSTPVIKLLSSSGLEDTSVEIRANSDWHHVLIGYGAGQYLLPGVESNVCVGWLAGRVLTSGYYNTIIGTSTGREMTTGFFNTLIGESAGWSIITGRDNVGAGVSSLRSVTSGKYNVGVGNHSGRTITTGQYNVFLGHNAGYHASQKVDATNSIAIGYNTYTTADNQVVYGNSSIASHIFQAGNLGLGTTSPQGNLHISAGDAYGGLYYKTFNATVDITAAASATITLNIPAGAKLDNVQMRVDSALATGETWDAAWNDGSDIQAIVSGAAVAKSTKVNKFFDVNAATNITDATTNIVITKNGGGSFTAQGTIRAVGGYWALDALDNAP